MPKTRIGITLRIVKASNYEETRDALSHDWAKFLEKMEMIPIFIPNNLNDIEGFLEEVNLDGIIISGGDNIGDYPQRDNTEKIILEYSVKNNKPIFGVCRGMQVINDFFGGEIKNSTDRKHVGENHVIKTDTRFTKIFGSESIEVNSFHNNIIEEKQLGKDLIAFAYAEDKTIEGFYHKSLPITCVMWHPERDPNSNNQEMIKSVF